MKKYKGPLALNKVTILTLDELPKVKAGGIEAEVDGLSDLMPCTVSDCYINTCIPGCTIPVRVCPEQR